MYNKQSKNHDQSQCEPQTHYDDPKMTKSVPNALFYIFPSTFLVPFENIDEKTQNKALVPPLNNYRYFYYQMVFTLKKPSYNSLSSLKKILKSDVMMCLTDMFSLQINPLCLTPITNYRYIRYRNPENRIQ